MSSLGTVATGERWCPGQRHAVDEFSRFDGSVDAARFSPTAIAAGLMPICGFA